MRLIFIILYLISFTVSITIFYLIHLLSFEVRDGYAGGNGNPGIFFMVFGYPFLAFFIYGTIEYLMRFLTGKEKSKWFSPTLFSAGILVLGIISYTFWSAFQVREQIARELPAYYRTIEDISLLNPYTNKIFINWLTFLALLLFCYVTAGFWARNRNK